MNDLSLPELLVSGTYIILPTTPGKIHIRITNYLLALDEIDWGGSTPECFRPEDKWVDARLGLDIPLHGEALMFGMMTVEIFVPEVGQHARIRSPQRLEQLKKDVAAQIVSTVQRRLRLTGGKPAMRSPQEFLVNQLLRETSESPIEEAMGVAVKEFFQKNRGKFEPSVLRGIFIIHAMKEFDTQS